MTGITAYVGPLHSTPPPPRRAWLMRAVRRLVWGRAGR
jgi:hypothetical protein